jgi:hypothetical protein|tara:strand:+ start:3537 stop:3722 length:186 start_codon:yes stop_codon:yes gene_type:complete
MIVNCAYKEMVPLRKLVPHPRNPNTHPDDQIRLLMKIIDYQGWRNPKDIMCFAEYVMPMTT